MVWRIFAGAECARFTKHSSLCPQYGPRYAWSAYQQSILVGAYFYGNVLTFPAGLLVERFGYARRTIIASFAVCTLLAVLTPLAALAHRFALMFAVRFGMGMAQGLLYPAYTKLISRWAPPAEIGLFTSTLMGSNIGTVLAWCVSGELVEAYGWAVSFYANAAISAAFTVCCGFLIYDSPAVHPRCGVAERTLIEKSLEGESVAAPKTTTTTVGQEVAEKQAWPPLGEMACSLPFWALFALQFGNSWGSFFLVTAAPKFMSEILGFDIGKTGLLAGLPYLLRTLVAFGVAAVAKRLEMRYAGVSATFWRKFFTVFCE